MPADLLAAAENVRQCGCALFGAALLLACPLVIRAEASVSAELPLAMLLFLAFCL
jgi:hypothetical protein